MRGQEIVVVEVEHAQEVVMLGGDLIDTHVGDGGEWREIDRRLRGIAKRRAALEAEEAPLLLAAMRAEIHKRCGYGTFLEYLERACGYAVNTARERVRVAEALEALPEMRAALVSGEVCFSTVRELTRVAKPHTERAWLTAVDRCTVRDVEHAVRGHAPGDLPSDRPDPRPTSSPSSAGPPSPTPAGQRRRAAARWRAETTARRWRMDATARRWRSDMPTTRRWRANATATRRRCARTTSRCSRSP
jgi:hypothetical protein